MDQTIPLCWGARVSTQFRLRLFRLCDELGWSERHASWLMACMAFETGRSFSPAQRNFGGSGAVGLIQFMATTARRLGTTTAALARMSAVEQLGFVERYFRPYAARVEGLEDMYLAILWPAAVGKPSGHVLWRRGTPTYAANRGLDLNRNGAVTKQEAAAKARELYAEGMLAGNVLPAAGGMA